MASILLALALPSVLLAQSLSPSSPAKEYVYVGGKLLAIEAAGAPSGPGITVSASPLTATLGPSQQQQFIALLTPSAGHSVTWSLTPAVGTISNTPATAGLYTAPSSISSAQTVTVRATSSLDANVIGTATVTLQPPASAPLPDLRVTSLSAPTPVVKGAQISVPFTAQNAGTGAAAVFEVKFYLSSDSIITTSDQFLGSVWFQSGMAGSSSQNSTAILTIPTSAPTGTRHIGAYADPSNAIIETNETNNTRSFAIVIQDPALTTPNLVMFSPQTVPRYLQPGGFVTHLIAPFAGNLGGATSATFRAGIYRSTDNVITTSDTLVGNCSISGISAAPFVGGVFSKQCPTIPAPFSISQAGVYFIGGYVDDLGQVPEGSTGELDNAVIANTGATGAQSGTIEVTPFVGYAELISGLVGPPAIANIGQQISLTANVSNIWNGYDNNNAVAGPPVPVGFYLSTDSVIDRSVDTLLGSCNIPTAIANGNFGSCGAQVTIPSTVTPGTYYLFSYADHSDTIPERYEHNNAAGAAIDLVPGNPTPQAVSVTPSSGNVATQTFTFVASDASGHSDIEQVQMLFHSVLNYHNSCAVTVHPLVNNIYLLNDIATNWGTPIAAGAAGTLQNSQCTIDPAASSISGSGNNLTINLKVTFKPAFGGTKNTYMSLYDGTSPWTSWATLGTWSVPGTANQAPTAVSVTPASGSGSSQTFNYVFSDPNGWQDLDYVLALFQTSVNGANACYVRYYPYLNTVFLSNDSDTVWLAGGTLGTPGIVENSQCSLNVGSSSGSGTGNNVTLNLALSFKAAFAGTKNNYMNAVDSDWTTAGWQLKGTWTATVNPPPQSVSVTPSSGSGSTQAFSYLFSDANGFADINSVQIMVNSTLNSVNSCQLYYVRPANQLYLRDDANTTWIGPVTPGAPTTLQNSQCVANVASTTVSGTGTQLTFNTSLTFKPAFIGAKNNYMVAYDAQATAWQQKGTWTVPANQAPQNVSVTPSSGSGSSQTFAYKFSDTSGAGTIVSGQIVVHSTLTGLNSCYVYYSRATSQVYLMNNANTAWSSPMQLGTTGTLENSQCIIDVGASSHYGTGDPDLYLTLKIIFKAGYAGSKKNYMTVYDGALDSGWQQKGTWTVP